MPFDDNAAYRRINALCSTPAPARYLHLSLGEVIQLENIERRRRLITVSDLETEAWRKLP
ncbi:hypothetical protein ACLHTJ_33140 [Pseudomonas aeruginosa]|uniref:hypothetical protein n=1 Tax=Pseudomonas aeruginosa TaxID=287 RepID=UPI002904BCD4|nr:hypothetical protein [Pseudomonas aeruginosa]MDU0537193.1 hypothetical protein [Pseudomonas aeruginosa]MEA8681430.1 hypothetical protein [Pseudomonas aeruginosa]MEA8694387.1 hypothetical protein [Pseudomonas aeruginosa]